MSKFKQIVTRGHQKTGFSERKGKLLMSFSEQDHRRIAQLIARWLDDETDKPQKTPARQSSR